MAKALKNHIPRPTPRPLADHTVTLVLTQNEAVVIMALCGRVGGDPNGWRKYSDNVFHALHRIGVNSTELPGYGGVTAAGRLVNEVDEEAA